MQMFVRKTVFISGMSSRTIDETILFGTPVLMIPQMLVINDLGDVMPYIFQLSWKKSLCNF